QPVEEAEQVEKEWVAAQAREELHRVTTAGDYGVAIEGHGCMLDQALLLPLLVDVAILELCALRNLGAGDVRELVAVFLGCEAIAKRDVRLRVAVGVHERLVDRVGTKFVGVRGR